MNYVKPVLDFIKAQVFLVVCVAVVLVALLALWLYAIPTDTHTAEEMTKRYDRKAAIEGYGRQPINFPGLVFYDANGAVAPPPAGVIIPRLTDLKKQASSEMERQKQEIDKVAAAGNTRNRLGPRGLPLLDGKERDGYLPTHRGVNLHVFRDELYKGMFERWTRDLTGSPELNAGVVQPRAEIENSYREAAAARIAALPPQLRPVAGAENAMAMKEVTDFAKGHLSSQAQRTAMYVDPDKSFQRRAYAALTREPTDSEVFESFVDGWLIGDVVSAIKSLNGKSSSVLTSPVKNLMMVSVGQHARGAFGAAGSAGGGAQSSFLFEGMLGANAAAGRPGMPTPTPGVDLTRSMTGRVGTEAYDVVMMHVSMVATPEAVNQFIEELYKRNNGYTVVNRRESCVDPYEAVSRGYMYGKSQCVQVDLLIETLLFKDWTKKIVPPNFAGSGAVVTPGGGDFGGGEGEMNQ